MAINPSILTSTHCTKNLTDNEKQGNALINITIIIISINSILKAICILYFCYDT